MTRFAVRTARAAICLAAAGALGGCVTACPTVPPVQAETIPPPPPSGEQQTWQPGHWNYDGGQFVWEPGHFIPSGPGHAGWVGGAFAPGPNGGACTWVPAHWVG